MASCAPRPSSSRSLQLPPTVEDDEDEEERQTMCTSKLEQDSASSTKPSSSSLLIPPSDASAVSCGSIQPQSARNLIRLTSNLGSGVTYAGQDSLPRLPIPDLHETMEKFQYRLEALQEESQWNESKRVVQEFLKGEGPKLQEALREYEAEGIADERIGVRSLFAKSMQHFVSKYEFSSNLCLFAGTVLCRGVLERVLLEARRLCGP